jgi:hypothetical protein
MSESDSGNGYQPPSSDSNSEPSIGTEEGLSLTDLEALAPAFQHQIKLRYRRSIRERWLVIVGLWLTVGIYSLWELRYPISLMGEDFTWAAVKYGIAFQPIPAFGLFFCVMMTISTISRQIRVRLWGLSKEEQQLLAKKVKRGR